jgi:type I restriction enzyme S subunit
MDKLHEQWPIVPLSAFLTKVRRSINVQSQELYSQIGIRSHGKGIFHKEPISGAEIGDKQIFWVEPGDFVLNIVFAWEGAVALTSEKEKGMCASHRFPTFVPNPTLCDPQYLLRYFQTPIGVEQLGLCSPGGAGRNRTLNQAEFLSLSIPLPPLAEQHKIAAILGTWDAAIATVEELIAALQTRKQGLMHRLLTGEVRFPEFAGSEWEETTLGEIATINPRKSKVFDEAKYVSFVSMADVSEQGKLVSTQIRPYTAVSSGYTFFEDNDVLVAKITPCLENGKGALARNLENGVGFGSTEFMVLRAELERALPEFIFYHSITQVFRQQAEQNMVGSAGQKRVRPDFVSTYSVLLPSISEQLKITETLICIDKQIDSCFEYNSRLRQQKQALMQQLLTGQVRVLV